MRGRYRLAPQHRGADRLICPRSEKSLRGFFVYMLVQSQSKSHVFGDLDYTCCVSSKVTSQGADVLAWGRIAIISTYISTYFV